MDFLRKPSLALGVTIVLLVSLPLLAWFQYQWLGRLSENEHERMRSNLKISADKLTEEFDTELARGSVCVLGPGVLDGEWWFR